MEQALMLGDETEAQFKSLVDFGLPRNGYRTRVDMKRVLKSTQRSKSPWHRSSCTKFPTSSI